MNRIDYSSVIIESSEELLALERQQTHVKSRDRIKFIRLLKSEICQTQEAAGRCIGVKRTQSQQIWRDYKKGGILQLIKSPIKRGFGKLSSHQLSLLQTRLSSDDICTLVQVQHWLISEFEVYYTLAGLSALFNRLKIKLKTGRPSNIRKDQHREEAFKKTLNK